MKNSTEELEENILKNFPKTIAGRQKHEKSDKKR